MTFLFGKPAESHVLPPALSVYKKAGSGHEPTSLAFCWLWTSPPKIMINFTCSDRANHVRLSVTIASMINDTP